MCFAPCCTDRLLRRYGGLRLPSLQYHGLKGGRQARIIDIRLQLILRHGLVVVLQLGAGPVGKDCIQITLYCGYSILRPIHVFKDIPILCEFSRRHLHLGNGPLRVIVVRKTPAHDILAAIAVHFVSSAIVIRHTQRVIGISS